MSAQNMAKKSLGLHKVASGLVSAAMLCSAATVTLAPRTAHAEESSPTGKGIAGGVLLGGELVMVLEAAFDVQKPLAYALGALGGGIAGGVGGYFVEQSSGDAKIPSYMLAAGVAFLIPATVMAFNATTYRPPADYQEDRSASGAEPVADAPQPGAAPGAAPPTPAPGGGNATPPAKGPQSKAPAPSAPRYSFRRRPLVAPPVATAPSLVGYNGGQLQLSLPAVEVRPVFSQQELRQFGMAQREEVRIPVFQARF